MQQNQQLNETNNDYRSLWIFQSIILHRLDETN